MDVTRVPPPRTLHGFANFMGGAITNPAERNIFIGLGLLFFATAAISPFFVGASLTSIALVMSLSYLNNACYSVTSRSGTRNSGAFHATVMLCNSLIWFSVLRELFLTNLAMAYFVPYTIATVAGSITGSKLSQRIEEYFGITTDSKAKESATAVMVKRVVLAIAAIYVVATIPVIGMVTALTIIGLMFLNDVAFLWLRRARNSSHAWYHVMASVIQSATFFFLYSYLTRSMKDLSFMVFIPYSFGAVFAAVFGHKTAMRFERLIGAGMDDHVKDASINIFPTRIFAVLVPLAAIFAWFSGDTRYAVVLIGISAAQQVAFAVVSRSRSRNNLTYHAIASVFSNGVWFLVFRQLQQHDWTLNMYLPYAAGAAIGSIAGAAVSMAIERKLKIVSN